MGTKSLFEQLNMLITLARINYQKCYGGRLAIICTHTKRLIDCIWNQCLRIEPISNCPLESGLQRFRSKLGTWIIADVHYLSAWHRTEITYWNQLDNLSLDMIAFLIFYNVNKRADDSILGKKYSRFTTRRNDRSEWCSHAAMRIVKLLKGWSRGVTTVERRRGIAQHVHVRSRGRMMWWRIVRRIRADHWSRD